MTAGGLDANGIWQYGEDDPLSPFSTFMNLLAASVSAQLTRNARGILPNGYAAISADAGAKTDTTFTDVPGLTVTVTTQANRQYRISACLSVQSTVAGDRAGIQIRQDGVNAVQGAVYCSNANVGNTVMISRIIAPAAGSHTYTIADARNSGTGTVAIDGGGGNPCYIMVEDIGSSV